MESTKRSQPARARARSAGLGAEPPFGSGQESGVSPSAAPFPTAFKTASLSLR